MVSIFIKLIDMLEEFDKGLMGNFLNRFSTKGIAGFQCKAVEQFVQLLLACPITLPASLQQAIHLIIAVYQKIPI
jgi:hypothetical protein